jgi:serine/threonine protein kinase
MFSRFDQFPRPMQPTQLGPYRIIEQLGKGGMGYVYRAVDDSSGETVAVKVLSPQLAMADGFRDRFEGEIESLKTLRHSGIVRLLGYGEQDGALFYSMELVEGASLEEELRAGRRFNWREVAEIAIQVCRALKHAHDHGVIHRDIKPANILLTKNERVKLADFGIARLFGGTQLTTAGGILGTADYMPPEQAEGRPVTARCDQYSLGGVMYALLAGRPPFKAKNLPEMLQLQRYAEAEPVRRYAPETPEQLEQIVMQLLSKEPADRFPNTLVLSKLLEAMLLAFARPESAEFDLAAHRDDFDTDSDLSEPSLADRSLAATQAETRQPTRAGHDDSHAITPGASDVPSISLRPLASTPSRPIVKVIEPATHFTDVEKLRAAEEAASSIWWMGPLQVALGVAALVALASAGWWLLRPASADELYAQITTAAAQGDTALRATSSSIDTFLARYPADSRADEVAAFADDLGRDMLERRLALAARTGSTARRLSAPEQLYVTALRGAEDTPDQSLATFNSLAKLLSESQAQAPTELLPTGLAASARRQAARITERLKREASELTPLLAERIATAEKLASTEPAKSRELCQAVLDLVGNRAWAAGQCARANKILQSLSAENK